jgi:hypothetical protein
MQGRCSTVLADVVRLLDQARRSAARAVNVVMTATYWQIGQRIVESDQRGAARAGYGQRLLYRLSADLGRRFGRGFSVDNLEQMRRFYLCYASREISETSSRKSEARRPRRWPLWPGRFRSRGPTMSA